MIATIVARLELQYSSTVLCSAEFGCADCEANSIQTDLKHLCVCVCVCRIDRCLSPTECKHRRFAAGVGGWRLSFRCYAVGESNYLWINSDSRVVCDCLVVIAFKIG